MRILSSGKEQKEENSFQEKLEFSTSSLIPKLLDEQATGVQTKSWLNQNYPPEQRSQIKFLEISGKGLSGLLDLTDFVSLEELYCYDNQLTGIKFSENAFDKLRVLHVGNNQYPSQDLSLFSRLIKLEVLNLGNNNFTGSLKFLKNLTNLRSLDISDTNIEDGLIYLSDQLESLFCRVEKKVKCRKISEALKDYDLGHDCYDFQAWKKDENWLVMPGSWPKEKFNQELKVLKSDLPSKRKKLFTLVNSIYQNLVLVEEKDIEKMQKEARKILLFDNFEDELELDFNSLLLVAESHLLTNQKLGVLEEKIKKLRQDNKLLEEKNEFWKFLRLELTKQNEEKKCNIMLTNCVECGKEYEENHHKELGYRYDKSFSSYLCDDCRKSEGKEIEKIYIRKNNNKFKNNKIKNTMTNTNNTTNEKIFILEWESAELKDRTMRYENFKVITGSEKGNLLFYSTFFVDEFKFKKGEVYQLSTPGNFVEDTSGAIPGSFDASGIIQGIDNGSYEFEKVAPVLLIKELWEEKEEKAKKLNSTEKDLEQKKKDATKINQELLSVRKELSDLQNKFSNLQLEKDERVSELSQIKENLKNKEKEAEEKRQKLVNSEEKVKQLEKQLANLQSEKDNMESEWVSPEEKKQSQQEKK